MGPTNLGQLVYTLTLNDEGFAEQTDAAQASMDDLAGTADTTSASLDDMGVAADTAGASMEGAGDIADTSAAQFDTAKSSMLSSMAPLLVAVGAYVAVKSALSEATEVQAAQAQIVQALKSTGDASGETITSLTNLAQVQSDQTDFSKAQVLGAESVALTFTNIGKNVFPGAVTAAENISQKFGVALPSAMKIVGKALEDPTKGMATLTRYIGTLNASQTDQINSMMAAGDAAGAQSLLLDILADKTGGAATAATDTFAGKMKELKNEAIDRVSDSLEKLGTWLDKHIKLVMTLAGVLVPLIAGILAIVTAVKIWTMAVAAFNAISDMNPWLLAITAIALIAIEVVTHWNNVKQWFDDFWKWIKGVFDDIVGFIKNNWELLAAILILPLAPVLVVWKLFHDQIIALFKDAFDVVTGIWNGITGFFSSLWGDIKSVVGEIGTILSGAFKDAFNAIIDLWDNTMGKIFHGQKISVGPIHFDLPDLNIPKMADGGIVDTATLALIGEAGPEAVVPLNGKNSPMGGNTYNIQQVILSSADAVDEFFNISNRNTALELNGGSPLAGTGGV
jgi:hypothetical protein